MELKLFTSPGEFRDQAFAFLCRDEVQNGLLIGLVDLLITNPDSYPKAYLWALMDRTEIAGAAWWTPPRALGLTDMPADGIEVIIENLSLLPDKPGGVVGPKALADDFCQRWIERHRASLKSTVALRIHKLTEVTMPFPVPGQMRTAEAEDLPLLEEWGNSFSRDCGINDTAEDVRKVAQRHVRNRSRYLWIDNGRPVSMAASDRKTLTGVTINCVYTPNEFRTQGYASALVAALSQKWINEGRRFCCLYTDLAIPTATIIYQKAGYRPVADSAHHTFGGS